MTVRRIRINSLLWAVLFSTAFTCYPSLGQLSPVDLEINDDESYLEFRSAITDSEFARTSYLVNPSPRLIGSTTALAEFATNNPQATEEELLFFLSEFDSRLRSFSIDDPNLRRGASLLAAIESSKRILDTPALSHLDTRVGDEILAVLGLRAPQYLFELDPTGGAREARALSFELGSTRSLLYSSAWANVLTLSFMGRDLNGNPHDALEVVLREFLDTEGYPVSPSDQSIDADYTALYQQTASALQEMPLTYGEYSLLVNGADGSFQNSDLNSRFSDAFTELSGFTIDIFQTLEDLEFSTDARDAQSNAANPSALADTLQRRVARLTTITEERATTSWAGQFMLQSDLISTQQYATIAIGTADLRLETADTVSTAQTVMEVGTTAALLGIAVGSKDPGAIIENTTSLASLAFGLAGEDNSYDSTEQQIYSEIQSVRQDIAALGNRLDSRFDDVEKQLNEIYTALNSGFGSISDQLAGIQQDIGLAILALAENRASLDRIEGALWVFAQEKLLGNLETRINLDLNFTAVMPYDRFLDAATLFEGFATGVSLAGSTAYSGPNPPIMSVCGGDDPTCAFDQAQQAIGDSYGSSINEIVAFSGALAPGVVPQARLVSPSAWSKAAASLAQLCEEQPWHVKYSFDSGSGTGISSRLNSTIAEGERIKAAQRAGRSADLFLAILQNHRAAVEYMLDIANGILYGTDMIPGVYDSFYGIDPMKPSVLEQTAALDAININSTQGCGSINSSSWGSDFWRFWSPSTSYPDNTNDAAVVTSLLAYITSQNPGMALQRNATWTATDTAPGLRRLEFVYTVSAGNLTWSCSRTFENAFIGSTRTDCDPIGGCFTYVASTGICATSSHINNIGPGPFVSGDNLSNTNYLPFAGDFGLEYLFEIRGTDSSNPNPVTNTFFAQELLDQYRLDMKNDIWNTLLESLALEEAEDRAQDWHVILDAFASFYIPAVFNEDPIVRSALRTSYFDNIEYDGGGWGIKPDLRAFIESENAAPNFGMDRPPFARASNLSNLFGAYFVPGEQLRDYMNATQGQSTHSYLDYVLEELKQIEANSQQLATSDQVLTRSDEITVIPFSPMTYTSTPPTGVPYLTANDTPARFVEPTIESFTQPDWGCIELDTKGNFVFTPPSVCDPDGVHDLVESTSFTYTTKVAVDTDFPDPGEDGFAVSLPATVTIIFDDVVRPVFVSVPTQLNPTIQSAIDRIVDRGDSVIEVAPGTYFEHLNTRGKAFTLRSQSGDYRDTIIDGSGTDRVLVIDSGETRATRIEGITIQNGFTSDSDGGGGVVVRNSAPTFYRCWFTLNQGYKGGAVSSIDSRALFDNCLFSQNHATDFFGGAIRDARSITDVFACTIVDNTSNFRGSAITSSNDSEMLIVNSLIWNNGDQPLDFGSGADLTTGLFLYSSIDGPLPPRATQGTGVIFDEPTFVDYAMQDYRLAAGSAGIDAGVVGEGVTPNDLLGNERLVDDPNTANTGFGEPPVDMGAFEFQPPDCTADLNSDGELNFFDVSEFLVAFNAMDPVADFTGDGLYNFFDVSGFLVAFGDGCP